MKRFVSATTAILLVFVQLFALYGCSTKVKNPIVIGEWLNRVNSSFGIQPSDESSPYFSDITPSDPYYQAVQAAADWGIVTSDMKFKTDDNLTWSMMISTLLNAGNFVVETADEKTRTEYFRIFFDSSYEKKLGKKDVESDKAIEFLNAAVQKWASLKYEESYADVTYTDGVIDLASKENEIEYQISPETDTIVVKVSELGSPDAIKPGDIIIVPANDSNPFDTACAVEKVESPDGETVFITYSEDGATPETVIQDLHVQETVVASPSNFAISMPEGVDGATGNLTGTSRSSFSAPKAAFMDTKGTVKDSLEYEIDGFTVSFSSEVDTSGNVKFIGKLEAPDLIESDQAKLQSNVSFEVSDLKISHKEDINWFKVDYLKLNAEYKTKVSFAVEAGYENGVYERDGYDTIGKSFFSEISTEALKDLDPFSHCVDSEKMKIACITLFGANTIAGVTLDVSVVFKIDGSFEIVVEESGNKGIEYKDGKLRTINSTIRDKDANLSVTAELTVNCGPNVYGLGFKILGIEFSFGIGAEAKLTAHLADSENHLLVEYKDTDPNDKMNADFLKGLRAQALTATPEEIEIIAYEQGYNYEVQQSTKVDLKVDVCVDVKVYFIFRIGITSDSLLAKALKDKVEVSLEVLGKDNATFFNVHIDNFETVVAAIGGKATEDNCTLKYKEFEDTAAEDEGPGEDATQVGAERFAVAPLVVTAGESKELVFTFMPSGYKVSDFTFTSSNSGVATVDVSGNVTGITSGRAEITIKSSDGLYITTSTIVVI